MPCARGELFLRMSDRRGRAIGRLLVTAAGVGVLNLGMSAHPADRPEPQVTTGADGKNGPANVLRSNVSATPGQAGGDLTVIDVGTAAAGRDAAATIAIGSQGGRGGRGNAYLGASVPGAMGGRGGAVSVTLSEDVSGQGDQVDGTARLVFRPIPRFWVFSAGGDGADGQKDVGGGGDAGSAALTLSSRVSTVEIGGRVDPDGGRWIRPYGTLGGTFLSDDHFIGRASFQGTGALGLFSTESSILDRLGEAGLGLQISLGGGVEVTGEYQAQVGDHFLAQSGTARLQLRF